MSPRSALVALSLGLLAGAAALVGGHDPSPPSPPAPVAAESFGWNGTTGQGMVTGSRAGVRPSRQFSREALAAAAGEKITPAASNQRRETGAAAAALAADAEKAAKELAQDSWQLPIPRGEYTLTGRFGECSALWAYCHTGLDFAAPSGTPIRAVASGEVTAAGWAGAYGLRTVVTLRDGTEIWYCHQLEIGVRAGDTVAGGQVIGRVGSTGNSTGPHVHIEVRPGGGDAVDPAKAFAFYGATP